MSISGLVEQQAQARPGAPAVLYPDSGGDGGDGCLTYGQLSAAANRLAAHLRARGVGRGDRVVTSLGPGWEMVTAFLAIVRAGAVCVPLDPAAPAGRRLSVVRDSAARAVLAKDGGGAPYESAGVTVVAVDAEAAEIAARPAVLPAEVPGPEEAAYICYTAGTTGPPKGVVVPHRAVLDLVRCAGRLGVTAGDAVAQVAGPACDAVMFEVWAALTAGARLVGLGPQTVRRPDRFAEAVRAHGVSVVLLPTALLHRIARERPAALAPLRVVLFGGQVGDARAVRAVWEAGPPQRLLHVYGATEAATPAVWHEITAPPEGDGALPLGRPAGAAVAVVEGGDGAVVAPGGVGELLLGGPGVATGYLGRPDLDARHFVEDRFTGGGVLYRTGDLVLLREDGLLEFVGRVEDRVRVNGLCVDLGAVEAAVRAHPAVSAAAVSLHASRDGERHLVAYVVPARPAPRAAHRTAAPSGPGRTTGPDEGRGVSSGAGRGVSSGAGRGADTDTGRDTGTDAVRKTGAGAVRDVGTDAVRDTGTDAVRDTGTDAGRDPGTDAGRDPGADAVRDPGTDAGRDPGTDAGRDPGADAVRDGGLGVALAGHLRRLLPAHMVPSALVSVDALPLNAHGKTDRTALPAPAGPLPHRRPGTPPGTPVQEIVRDLFAEVLELPRHQVPADGDFFALGGHRLAAARLLARVRETLDADPGPGALIEAPTPAALAALVGDARAALSGPLGAGPDSAVLPLRLRGAVDMRALQEALEDLGRRHEALRNSTLGSAGTRLHVLAADDHRLDLALPADAVDAWSHLPLAAELARAYGARAAGAAPHRSPAGLDAAPRALTGDREPTALPGAAPAARHPSYGCHQDGLDAGLHERLTRFAARHGSTLFMVVHAALAAVLARAGAPGEVTVAAPVPARDRAGLRGAVGPYGRVLALTVDASDDPAFAELLRRVKEADLAAYRDGGAPLARPGTGCALAVVQEAAGAFTAAGLTVQVEQPVLPVPAADVAFTLTERQTRQGAAAGIGVTAVYRHETVGEESAVSLTARLTAVLQAVLDAPWTALSRLPLPLPEGAHTVGGVWAGADVAVPARQVAELFAEQAARAPRALALASLTYGELDARSDLLAHALIEHRAGPGASVLTALSSPVAFAVAALAVAKTGAALVAVDPAAGLPEGVRPVVLLLDETADLLLEAVPGAVRLVRDDTADRLVPTGRWPVGDAERTRPLAAGDPVLLVPGEDGTVVIGAAAVAAAAATGPAGAAWLVRGYPDEDAVLGLLGALVSGARVHVPDGAVSQAVPHEVLGWLRRQDARLVLGGADDLLGALAALARTEGVELTLSGGWAEGRLVVEQSADGSVRPAPGYRAYVLDGRMRPVGPGGTGTLYVAGAGVALGYAGRTAASGERFLPDPFAAVGEGTARMWRTGRAARLLPGGDLRVLDRPAGDDPFADGSATFMVLADDTGHRALWPAAALVPEGWQATHPEDLYELCLDHINDHLNDAF
ncbi:amino acid adenylation domain-containing protein [Streptomyces flaveolus]|uniref:amino acid adenylation domain-containing protein n=1 Tax=Streptomyces flaveolus TaxID=67297 RepID=UPI00331CEF66